MSSYQYGTAMSSKFQTSQSKVGNPISRVTYTKQTKETTLQPKPTTNTNTYTYNYTNPINTANSSASSYQFKNGIGVVSNSNTGVTTKAKESYAFKVEQIKNSKQPEPVVSKGTTYVRQYVGRKVQPEPIKLNTGYSAYDAYKDKGKTTNTLNYPNKTSNQPQQKTTEHFQTIPKKYEEIKSVKQLQEQKQISQKKSSNIQFELFIQNIKIQLQNILGNKFSSVYNKLRLSHPDIHDILVVLSMRLKPQQFSPGTSKQQNWREMMQKRQKEDAQELKLMKQEFLKLKRELTQKYSAQLYDKARLQRVQLKELKEEYRKLVNQGLDSRRSLDYHLKLEQENLKKKVDECNKLLLQNSNAKTQNNSLKRDLQSAKKISSISIIKQPSNTNALEANKKQIAQLRQKIKEYESIVSKHVNQISKNTKDYNDIFKANESLNIKASNLTKENEKLQKSYLQVDDNLKKEIQLRSIVQSNHQVLKKQSASYQQSVKKLQAQNKRQKVDIQILNKQKAEWIVQIDRQSQHIRQLQDKNQHLQKKLKEVASNNKIQSEIKGLREQNQRYAVQVKKLEGNSNQIKKNHVEEINKLNSEIKNITNKSNSEISNLKLKINQQSQAHFSKISTLEQQIAGLNNEKKALNDSLNKKQLDVTKMRNQIEGFNNTIVKLRQEKESIVNRQKQEKNKEMTSIKILESQRQNLLKENEQLYNDANFYYTQFQKLKVQHQKLVKVNEESLHLKQEIGNKDQIWTVERNQLISQNQQLNRQKQQLESEKQIANKQRLQISGENQRINQQKQKILTQNQQLSRQKQQLSSQKERLSAQSVQASKKLQQLSKNYSQLERKSKTLNNEREEQLKAQDLLRNENVKLKRQKQNIQAQVQKLSSQNEQLSKTSQNSTAQINRLTQIQRQYNLSKVNKGQLQTQITNKLRSTQRQNTELKELMNRKQHDQQLKIKDYEQKLLTQSLKIAQYQKKKTQYQRQKANSTKQLKLVLDERDNITKKCKKYEQEINDMRMNNDQLNDMLYQLQEEQKSQFDINVGQVNDNTQQKCLQLEQENINLIKRLEEVNYQYQQQLSKVQNLQKKMKELEKQKQSPKKNNYIAANERNSQFYQKQNQRLSQNIKEWQNKSKNLERQLSNKQRQLQIMISKLKQSELKAQSYNKRQDEVERLSSERQRFEEDISRTRGELESYRSINVNMQKKIQQTESQLGEKRQIIEQMKTRLYQTQKKAERNTSSKEINRSCIEMNGNGNGNGSMLQNTIQFMSLYQGTILQNELQLKSALTQIIENHKQLSIKKTKFLFKLDSLNKTNFHQYFDEHVNVLLIVKTVNETILAGFSDGIFFKNKKVSDQDGLIISLKNRKNKPEVFKLKEKNKKAISYDDFYMMFGNSQIRLKSQEKKVFSNFGVSNGAYESRGFKIDTLLGGTQKEREVQIDGYEIYQIFFNE